MFSTKAACVRNRIRLCNYKNRVAYKVRANIEETINVFESIKNIDLELNVESNRFDFKKDLEIEKVQIVLRISLLLNTLIILLNI